MRRIAATTALLATALATPALAQNYDVNAFLGPVMADPSAAEITAKCDKVMGENDRLMAQIEGASGPATMDVTLKRFDDIYNLQQSALGEFTLYREVLLEADERAAAGDCEVRIAEADARLNLSRPVYDRLKAIDTSGADATTKYYLKRTLEKFEREGVSLDEAKRAEVKALKDEIAALGTEFDRNIAEDATRLKVLPSELAGLPQDYIESHPAGGNGLVELTMAGTDYSPVMTYADSPVLRERMARAYLSRAYPENDEVLRKLFTKRQELAELLGRPNYAALVLEDRMVNTPAKVESLLEEMGEAARPSAESDLAVLRAMREQYPALAGGDVSIFNSAWLARQAKQKYFDYNPLEARDYFLYDNVRDGILELTEDLFRVDIRPWDVETWHEDVETYEVVEDGQVIGRFYFDNHPRQGKYTHANMIPLRAGIEGTSMPVGALVQNFPAGKMEHSQVETFLHEFGHMLHAILGAQDHRWFGISGITNEWDFVEAPSQMLENWVYDYDTLAKFAKNEAGQTIPRELVEKMNAARYFGLGLSDMRQLGLSNISLRFHEGVPEGNLGELTRAYEGKYDPLGYPEGTQMQDAFGHLNGYSAAYYTYRWSVVVADDMFTRFASEGLRNPQAAADYRRYVLMPGGSKPSAELVREFLGRDISIDAYREKVAKGVIPADD